MSATMPSRPPEARPKPPREHPAPKPGDPGEAQRLISLSFERKLTPDEDARMHALTFSSDVTFERARIMVALHPDLAGMIPSEIRSSLESYEQRRQAALDAGVAITEPGAGAAAEIDHLASEARATAIDPYLTLDDDHRAAFRAAVLAGDFGAVVREWSAWLAANTERNAFARRRAAAVQGFGRSTFADVRRPPMFLIELEAALDGASITEMLPIIQH